MANINSKEHWDNRWTEEPMFSRKLEKILAKLIQPNTSFLDVGFGSGRMLRGMRKDKRCTVFGLDISEVAVKKLKRYGIDSKAVDLETFQDIPSADIILCSHTLEHIDNDEQLIKNIAKATKRYAIFVVPNDCMSDEPEHVHTYSKESLNALLLKHFKLVQDHSQGVHLILIAFP